MATINVYEQYFKAEAKANGRKRHGALVALISDSEAGQIKYEAAVNFFPHDDAEDFAISYDGYVEEIAFEGKGRRSKKKEAAYLAELKERADALAAQLDGSIDWERPLIEPRRG